MLMRAAAWGVDLTGGAVRAVHVERVGRRYRILDVVEQPSSGSGEGAEPLSAHLPDSVGRALTDLLQSRAPSLGDALFVALPVFAAKHGRVELSVSETEQLDRLVDFELHQAIASDLEPWLVRAQPPRRHGDAGHVSDYFAQRREFVQTFVADLRRFGLPFDGIVPGPLALARYAETEWPVHGRRLLIECQRTRTDLLYLLPDGRRRWRSLPLGCGALADEPVHGDARALEATRLAIRLRQEQHEAHVSLFGAHDGTPLERIVLLGEAARHEELRRALEQELGSAVVTPHASHTFDMTTRAAAHQPLHHGTALGLALAALDPNGEPWSLIEPPRGRRLARALPALSTALLAVAAGLLCTHVVADRQVQALTALHAAVGGPPQSRQHDEWNAALEQANAATERTRSMVAQVEHAQRRWPALRGLLEALTDPARFFRLVAVEVTPGEPTDQAQLVFEVNQGVGGAADAIQKLLLEKASLIVTSVATRTRDDGALELTLAASLTAPRSDP